MNIRILAAAISTTLLLAACAGRPVVDTKNVDMARYERDLAECQAYADQSSTTAAAGRGAVGGAALGGILGAIFGDSGSAARGAGAGGVIGGARGAASGSNEEEQIVKNCLRGRGYSVLN